jgi:hypothetical protein
MGVETTTNIILGSLRYASSPNVNDEIDISLTQNTKEIVDFDRVVDLSLETVYDDERQSSTIFRPSTKFIVIFKNEFSGSTTYTPYKNNLYYSNPINNASSQLLSSSPSTVPWDGYPQYQEFDFIRTDNNVVGYTQPPNNHSDFFNKSGTTYNWTQYMSYPFKNDYTKQMYTVDYNTSTSWSWIVNQGIPYLITIGNDLNNRYIRFRSPVKHGLTVGEYVKLSTNYNGETLFKVTKLGDSGYGSDEYIFNVRNVGFTGTTFSTNNTGTFKRVISKSNESETTSKYYVRVHKIITNVSDSVLVKSGFEQNIFRNITKDEIATLTPNNTQRSSIKEGSQSYTLSFNTDIDINPLRDNQNRPISKLYFTTIWKGFFGWTKNLKQGWEFNMSLVNNQPSLWWDTFNVLSDTTIPENNYLSETLPSQGPFYYNVDRISGDTLDGDFCEWNDYQQTERVISRYCHKIKFNNNWFYLTNDNPQTNQFGYYYYPHNEIIIREFSDYVEESLSQNIVGLPDYSYYSNLSNGFRWRDLYPYGFIDQNNIGVDYPFTNGKHYPFVNTIFRIIPEGTNVQNINEIQDPLIDDCE